MRRADCHASRARASGCTGLTNPDVTPVTASCALCCGGALGARAPRLERRPVRVGLVRVGLTNPNGNGSARSGANPTAGLSANATARLSGRAALGWGKVVARSRALTTPRCRLFEPDRGQMSLRGPGFGPPGAGDVRRSAGVYDESKAISVGPLSSRPQGTRERERRHGATSDPCRLEFRDI